MKRTTWIVVAISVLVVIGLFFSGSRSARRRPELTKSMAAFEEAAPAQPSNAPGSPPPEEGEGDRRRSMKSSIAKKGMLKILGSAGGDLDGKFDDVLGGGGSGYGSGIGSAMAGAGGIGGKHRGKMNPERRAKDGESSEMEVSGGEAAPTRAWFPETFLFEPLVRTDEQGRATVPVRVPDRLTSWRVLALAHSRGGGQAGAVASFAGTLPTYIDAVTPPFLMAGDEVRLPIQVVNTTEVEVSRSLSFEAQGALLSATSGVVRVPAAGSQVQYVTLKVDKPGRAAVKASLGGTDAVERTIDVLPVGRPVSQSQGGTLAAARELNLEGAAESIPGSERVRLLVFPGALALLRAELSAAPFRGGVSDDAYSLLLAGRASALLRSLGEEPNTENLRTLTLIAGQRAIRHGRAPGVAAATLLSEAALSHPDNPVLSRLGERMAATVASQQRPDGSCQGGDGWTLQRLLVTTADCTRAVVAADKDPVARRRAIGASTKAAGFFERNIERVEDGFTAAAILSSGAVSGSLAEKLRTKVLESLTARADGSKVLTPADGVVRADGSAPGEAEATALAVLALEKHPGAPLADLGTSLLGGYSPVYGWGDGQANLACMKAVLTLFKDPVPSNVKIVLELDGKPLSSGTLDAGKLKEVVSIEADAPGSAGLHRWAVRAEPPVPGLGFSLTLQAYVPWKKEAGQGGLELDISSPTQGKVGEPMAVTLTATAPAGMALKIRQALPAGVQPDSASLEALVQGGSISKYVTEDGAVTLEVPPRPVGHPFSASYKVVPTLAGTLHGSASTVEVMGRRDSSFAVPPEVWIIK